MARLLKEFQQLAEFKINVLAIVQINLVAYI